jgi:hypothetical protein
MISDFSGRGCLSRCVWLGIRIVWFRGFTPGFRGFSRFLTFEGFIRSVGALIFCCGLCFITFLSVISGFATILMLPRIYL